MPTLTRKGDLLWCEVVMQQVNGINKFSSYFINWIFFNSITQYILWKSAVNNLLQEELLLS